MSQARKVRFLSFVSTLTVLFIASSSTIKAACAPAVEGQHNIAFCRSKYPVACVPAPLKAGDMCCETAAECTEYLLSADPFCNDQVGTIRTALGCINASDPKALINQIVTWAVGIAGGAAFLTIAYSGFIFTTAAGDVKRVNEAKSFLMSALLGLALVALAVLILNFVGVQIFGLGGFGFSV